MKFRKSITSFLDTLLQEFDLVIEKHLTNHEGNIQLGINNSKLNGLRATITTNLERANVLLNAFCKFLPGSEKSYETFKNDILSLSKAGIENIPTQLKVAYLKHHKEETSFKFKVEVLANARQFSNEEDDLIKLIADLIVGFQQPREVDYGAYFNTKKQEFEFTAQDEANLKEICTKVADHTEISKVLYSQLVVSGVNNLIRMGLVGDMQYTAIEIGGRELKEFKYNQGTRQFEINWDRMLGQMFEIDEDKVEIKILNQSDTKKPCLPLIEINGERYRLSAPSISSVEDNHTAYKFRDLFDQDLNKLHKIIAILFKKKSGVLNKI